MCECGCTMNDSKYKFPGPGKSFYILSLSGHCRYCVAPAGVTLEHIKPEHSLYAEYKRGEFLDGSLAFENWADSDGVAIVTGMLSDEFIKATKAHLIGVSSKEMGENGLIDDCGAEVILDEMYGDAQTKPRLVQPSKGEERTAK